MINMKKVINYVLSVGSLLVTLFLLVITMFSWYVTNTKAEAKGIVATTEGITGDFDLYYWNKKTQSWEESSNSIAVELWPNEVVYYKLVGTDLTVGQAFSGYFKGISSSVDSSMVTGAYDSTKAKYTVSYANEVAFESATTNINVTVDEETKTLYILSASETAGVYDVSLDDILIQDVFELYTAPVITGTHAAGNDKPTGKGSTKAASITSTIWDETSVAATTSVQYFALSFDTTGDNDVDSYYQYQTLNIDSLVVSL